MNRIRKIFGIISSFIYPNCEGKLILLYLMKALADPGHTNGRGLDLPGTPRRINISPENRGITGQLSTNLPSLPLLPEEGQAVHHIQQAPEPPILYHFFNKRKAHMLCRYPVSLEYLSSVCVFFQYVQYCKRVFHE